MPPRTSCAPPARTRAAVRLRAHSQPDMRPTVAPSVSQRDDAVVVARRRSSSAPRRSGCPCRAGGPRRRARRGRRCRTRRPPRTARKPPAMTQPSSRARRVSSWNGLAVDRARGAAQHAWRRRSALVHASGTTITSACVLAVRVADQVLDAREVALDRAELERGLDDGDAGHAATAAARRRARGCAAARAGPAAARRDGRSRRPAAVLRKRSARSLAAHHLQLGAQVARAARASVSRARALAAAQRRAGRADQPRQRRDLLRRAGAPEQVAEVGLLRAARVADQLAQRRATGARRACRRSRSGRRAGTRGRARPPRCAVAPSTAAGSSRAGSDLLGERASRPTARRACPGR